MSFKKILFHVTLVSLWILFYFIVVEQSVPTFAIFLFIPTVVQSTIGWKAYFSPIDGKVFNETPYRCLTWHECRHKLQLRYFSSSKIMLICWLMPFICLISLFFELKYIAAFTTIVMAIVIIAEFDANFVATKKAVQRKHEIFFSAYVLWSGFMSYLFVYWMMIDLTIKLFK